jgi:diacylglycerol O-acyltransferase
MRRIKHGHEAAVGFVVQETISGLSRTVYEAAVDLLANRSVGVLTNVPGPRSAVFLAGSRLVGIVGWAPLSGDQPLSVTIYSYDGTVRVGIACDEGLVPGYHAIVDGFAPVFRSLQRRSGQGRTA